MKVFYCDKCGNLVFFENTRCIRCESKLAFIPELSDICALEPAPDQSWKPLIRRPGTYRECQNALSHHLCNWLIPLDDSNPLCRACRLNQVIPDLTVPGNLGLWGKLEAAKRRVLYTILRLRLPIEAAEGHAPLRFKFLADTPGAAVLTGHAAGIITVNLVEADDAERERRRANLREPFRTLLGHLRHEIAHYYWDRLVGKSSSLGRFRELFNDERQNYSDCLNAHYHHGAPADWSDRFVTAYASCHPWEDWAETFAHYLHITDTVETAASFGLTLRPRNHPQAETMKADPTRLSVRRATFEEILENWIPLTYALNELNRGMGLPDLYPFVISQPTAEKLEFIHELLQA
jgi:hypothetical protein